MMDVFTSASFLLCGDQFPSKVNYSRSTILSVILFAILFAFIRLAPASLFYCPRISPFRVPSATILSAFWPRALLPYDFLVFSLLLFVFFICADICCCGDLVVLYLRWRLAWSPFPCLLYSILSVFNSLLFSNLGLYMSPSLVLVVSGGLTGWNGTCWVSPCIGLVFSLGN